MFARFARRMTLLYVGVAACATALMLSLLAALGTYGYVRLLDDAAGQTAVHAFSFGARALALHEPFATAAAAFEREDDRSGIAIFAPLPATRAADAPAADPGRPVRGILGANPRTVTPPDRANRIGAFVAELMGAHPRRVAFDGARIFISVDPASVMNVVLLSIVAIALAGAIAGLAAWTAGSYITAEALRPLVEVTQALHRFAGRDFTPEPIAVAGRSEFDAVAEAYNAAALQVDAAFLEHERADERIRQFVADAGHELRTPLTVVLGFIEHVRRVSAPVDASLAAAFEGIDAEAGRMRRLIDNLVLLARLDSEERGGFVEAFSLGELLDELLVARRRLYPAVDVRLDSDEDAAIFASRDDVREALGNVLDNAFKYGAGKPVRIAVERLDETRVGVLVADGGPGVAPAQREAIFERFYRGDAARQVDGSGLGLAIARRAVQRAGGRLELLAQPRGRSGATFAFELPAGPPPAPARPVRRSLEMNSSADAVTALG